MYTSSAIPQQTSVRTRGKRYDQVKTQKALLDADEEEQKRRQERKKMIKRSNDRLRMLDEMGK
tara:strand:- start:59 stop:247 length:189 start_codon:yes stop_codon:yes gene_type:complete